MMLYLKFHVKQYKVEDYTRHALNSGIDVLSNIGEQTGLCIEIRFLSIMALVQIFYCSILRYCCYVLRKNVRKKYETENKK
jgi:hypothetical protein